MAGQTKLEDLSASERMMLAVLHNRPTEKQVGYALRDANYLCSLGLAKYNGNMQFSLSAAGDELYYEREQNRSSNPPEEAEIKSVVGNCTLD